MQNLVKSWRNSPYGVQIGRDITKSFKCISELWMQTQYDDKVSSFLEIAKWKLYSRIKKDDGLASDNDVLKHCQVIWALFYWVIVNELWMILSEK